MEDGCVCVWNYHDHWVFLLQQSFCQHKYVPVRSRTCNTVRATKMMEYQCCVPNSC